MLVNAVLFDNGAGGINVSFPSCGGVLLSGFNRTGGFCYLPGENAWAYLESVRNSITGEHVENNFFSMVELLEHYEGNVQDDDPIVQELLSILYME